jgi:hypothetical protein
VLSLTFQLRYGNPSIYFPLGAFAMSNPQNTSECVLMIQDFVETDADMTMNNTMVLGSMFLQQYNTWW